MFWTHLFSTKWFKASLSSTIVIILLTGYTPPSFAFIKDLLSYLGFQKRSLKKSAEGNLTAGGGRGECSKLPVNDTEKQLTALIPSIQGSPLLSYSQSEASEASLKSDSPSTITWVKSYTIEERPSFWFYVPYKYDEQSQLELAKLAIIDEQKHLNKVTPIYFKLPETPGIIQVKLPIHLEENKPYKWFFSIICDAKKPSRNPSVAGWIQRVPRQQFQAIKPSGSILTSRYYSYFQYELWYDGFTQLAQAYQLTRQHNKNLLSPNVESEITQIQADWLEFFQVLGFSEQKNKNDKIAREIADSPISTLECVRKNENQSCDE
ncbi:DUF928 domain-containing protein [Scytonema sp. UIC 10036]|uniref:DUF928 domain-containing protein n=1 Tax=Scytonema sp. UIC 10036 TaxID=2304196 RepID=UPI0012DA2E67|nr:DUF928 domain-containing protein [Scytonema sp. UIC 10036]MUG97313.1 DUF928 domain-containing protein [Scytonema sp. UIC 10036]